MVILLLRIPTHGMCYRIIPPSVLFVIILTTIYTLRKKSKNIGTSIITAIIIIIGQKMNSYLGT